MSKYRIISKYGDGLAIGNTLQEEGHEVDAWIECKKEHKDEGSYAELYDGIIDKVEDPTKGLSDDDVIIVDSTSIKWPTPPEEAEDDVDKFVELETLGDYLRGKGHKVVGGGTINDAMELDRKFGQDLALECGFNVPKEKEFTDYKDALKFVESTKGRYVLKPSGSKESYSVYPSRDWEDLSTQLNHLIDTKVPADKIILQEFTEGVQMGTEGIQMGIEGTWTGSELVGFNSTFEHKRLLSGSTGVLTGETGSIIFYYPDENNKLCKLMKKAEKVLADIKYPPGQVDCNFIHNEKGSWFLEWTPRQGYPSTYIQMFACHDWGTNYEEMALGGFEGYETRNFKYFGGINVFIPEYPYGKTRKDLVETPTPFTKLTSDILDHIQFVDVKIKNEKLVTGGTYGNLMCVTAGGKNPGDVRKKILALIKRFEIYPIGYRNDIGEDLVEDLANLKKWGFWTP
jgi:phosphoribosylamine--glycine ligase